MQQNTSMYRYIVGALVALAMTATANAQSKKAAAPADKPTKSDEKVDISDLENKYWAPKDTDFSVVQNRTYSKDGAIMLTPQFGGIVNDQFSEGPVMGATLNYFWSERFGVQATYLTADLDTTTAIKDLVTNYGSGVQPNHGRTSGYYGVGFNIVPFYAKMSFWGTRIIYFDMAITPTLGMTTYDALVEGGNKSKSAFTYGIDVSQYFFFNKWFAVRLDLKNQFYTQEVLSYRNTGPYVRGQKINDKSIQDTMWLLGAAFYF